MALEAANTFTSAPSLAGYLETVVSPHLTRRAESRFKSAGDSASGKWAELTEATKEIRENLGFSRDEINVRTGTLRDYLTKPNPVTVQDALGTTMEWPGRPGRNLNSRLAQASGKRRGPARWVVAFDAGTVAFILSTLESWVVSGRSR